MRKPEARPRRFRSPAAALGRPLPDGAPAGVGMGKYPTVDEMRARLASREPVAVSVDPATAVREERDAK